MDKFQITLLWTDLEIAGRFYAQAVNLNASTFLGKRQKEFFESLRSTMHNHTAIRSHLQNFKALEPSAFDEYVKTMHERPNETREAFELIRELEAFFSK
jgi:ubiquitin C-terminal hydrolase